MRWAAMIVVEQGKKFEVPDNMIENYKSDFQDMKIKHDRETLTFFRNAVIIMLAMAKQDAGRLKDPDFVGDIIRARAVREALKQTNMLYDA
jgi:hypothetical protein